MANTAIVGGTGLVGSHVFTTLLNLSSISHIDFLARRPPLSDTGYTSESHSSKVSTFISSDPPATWTSHIRAASPTPEIFFSSIATTRALAGGLAAQYALEHDANLELARAAKEAGTKVYVLISSSGANSKSKLPYLQLKGKIEDSIRAVGFERTVIIRPGMITGQREVGRIEQSVVNGLAGLTGFVSKHWLRDWWAQDALEIARAAVNAGVRAWEGKGTEAEQAVTVLEGKDIVRLGRMEWKDDP